MTPSAIRWNSERIGTVEEVLVEGRNPALGQWIGRTSQNKVMNFTAPAGDQPSAGEYRRVRVTRGFPNSLVGEVIG